MMNKRRFWSTVVLMSLAMLGLIALQSYWIRHDLQLKEQQFGQNVMLAMNNIVDQVEQKENMKIVVHKFMSTADSSNSSFSSDDSTEEVLNELIQSPPGPPPPPGPPTEISNFAKAVNQQIVNLRELRHRRYPDGDLRLNPDTATIDIRVEKDVQSKEVYAIEMKSQEQNLVQEEARFDSLASETEKRMRSKMRKLNTMMQKFTFQVADHNGNIFSRIDSITLDSIIHSELYNHEIDQPYNFGIANPLKGKLIYSKFMNDTSSIVISNFRLPLFPNDFFKRNEQLILTFPNKFNYLLCGMWPLIASSIIFTLIMIIGFIYTLTTVLKQKKLAEIKNDFINNMTHEFKTPIATIAIANESIRDPRVYGNYEKLDYFTSVIKDENQRMLNQVEHVLQMAQIDKGELALRKEISDVHDIIHHAVGSAFLPVEQREGKIELQLDATNAHVNADSNHLLNVFTNLIDNATKYSPENPLVQIKSWNENNYLMISVTDHGIGMTKEVQRRVFETFYRATSGNIHDVKGFGLGLSYVKAIVESHDGSITVISEPNKGSTFTVQLPNYIL